jgi:hypothetical protein
MAAGLLALSITASCVSWVTVGGAAAPAPTPAGLLVNFQASPALGIPVGAGAQQPQFSWEVAGGVDQPNHEQVSYHIVVTDADNAKDIVWDSGVVNSNLSISVEYSGPALTPASAFNWTVATTTSDGLGDVSTSVPSEPATFVTALDGFHVGASYIWAAKGNSSGSENGMLLEGGVAAAANENAPLFSFFRKVVPRPAPKVIRATAFVTAVTDEYMLCGYKLYVGGKLVGVGPGRGEAVVFGGNGTYMSKPYATYDLTSFIPASGDVLLAVQSMGSNGKRGTHGPACAGPCAGGG